jgi:hypothetical protein
MAMFSNLNVAIAKNFSNLRKIPVKNNTIFVFQLIFKNISMNTFIPSCAALIAAT